MAPFMGGFWCVAMEFVEVRNPQRMDTHGASLPAAASPGLQENDSKFKCFWRRNTGQLT